MSELLKYKTSILTSPEEGHLPTSISVFLAGGISGCPNWQKDFIKLCEECNHLFPNLVLINPRRKDFDVSDPSVSVAQIEWEFQYLRNADVIIFWFPHETVCPIALFELGRVLGRNRAYPQVFIGTHPDYPRRFDILHQVRLTTDNRIKVASSLEELAEQLFFRGFR